MDNDTINYSEIIDEAMHYVVRKVLLDVREQGLPGDHHFFITFATQYPGVMLSEELLKQYPSEMTIVLQHQYWDLEVEEDHFSIVLSFDNVKQNLTVPFDSLVSFADPSVKFGLQFNHYVDYVPMVEEHREFMLDDGFSPTEGSDGQGGDGTSNVVTLDSFRNKK